MDVSPSQNKSETMCSCNRSLEPKRRHRRTLIYSFVFIVGYALGIATTASAQTLYQDFVLLDFDGVRHQLKDIVRAHDVTLLSFWASWCAPCQKELQELNDYLGRQKTRVAVVAVSIDVARDLMKARRFVAQKKLSFIVLHDMKGEAKKAYGVDAIPRMFVIDRKGMIQAEHRGYKDFAEIESEVRRILGQQTHDQ